VLQSHFGASQHPTGDHILHVHNICRVISLVFPKEFLVFPTGNDLTEVIDATTTQSGVSEFRKSKCFSGIRGHWGVVLFFLIDPARIEVEWSMIQ